MSKIAITDYFDAPQEEFEILGNLVGTQVGAETEVLLVWHEKIDEKYITGLPKLRGVQRYGVGYDSLDLEYLISKGIICCNNPDYGTDEVADTAVAMIMNIARGVFQYNHAAKKFTNNWQENVNTSIKRNSDQIVGIIGAGRIGGNVLMKCNALKFQTVFYDPFKERGYEKMINGKRVDDLDALLEVADIVSMHVPLSAATDGIINQEFISKMKPGSSLVNTARGGLVKDPNDFYHALKSGHLNCVALDVLREEPPILGLLIDAWRNSEDWINGRLIINPHSSYYSQAAYKELRSNAAKNALRI